jgi:hypothetical protein
MPARAQGMDRSRPYGSDYLTFAEELRTQGALSFYDQTEGMLRAGNFERAFTRYLFLRANIRGQSLYAGLAASVDQRLQFLQRQMHLGEGAIQYGYRETYPQRRRRPKPHCPPPKKPAKPKKPSSEENPPETIIPAPPAQEKVTSPHKAEAKPSGTEAQPPAEGAQKPAGAAQRPAPAPTPTPSFWEKLKRRLKFWQKDAGGGKVS